MNAIMVRDSAKSRWRKAARKFWRSPSALALALVLFAIYGAQGQLFYMVHPPTNDIMLNDGVDARLLVEGLERAPLFRDTLAWWSGPWVAGEVCAFYRPLTSLVWWCEFQVFGRQAATAFLAVHALSHIITVLVAWLFLRELLGVQRAFWAVVAWTVSLPERFGWPGASAALVFWKDDPEMWCSTAYLLSLWCWLRFVRLSNGSERASSTCRARWVAGCVLWFAIALSFKEMAYTLPATALLIAWHERKLNSHGRWVLILGALAAAAWAWRWHSLGGWGFRFGSNNSWASRWFVNTMSGGQGLSLVAGQSGSQAVACLMLALFSWKKLARRTADTASWSPLARRRAQVRQLLQWTLVLAAAWLGLRASANADNTAQALVWSFLVSARAQYELLYSLVIGFILTRALAKKRRSQLFGWLWVLLTYAPLMTAPVTAHTHYIVALGWAIVISFALRDAHVFARHARRSWRKWQSTRSGPLFTLTKTSRKPQSA